LDAKAELVLGVRPLDLDLDDGRAGDGGQLHHSLCLGVLREKEESDIYINQMYQNNETEVTGWRRLCWLWALELT
jgi:hypothetical protein